MLKGKKGLYILLPIVAFIWGTIIYKIVDAFGAQEEETYAIAALPQATLETMERETFQIGTVTRDPFLGTLYKPAVKKVVRKKAVQSKKKDTLVWPSIRYQGLVTDKATGKAVFLIEINGNAQLLKQKQSATEITLIKGDKKAVTLSYKGKKKQFKI